jgi:hypothetical protein
MFWTGSKARQPWGNKRLLIQMKSMARIDPKAKSTVLSWRTGCSGFVAWIGEQFRIPFTEIRNSLGPIHAKHTFISTTLGQNCLHVKGEWCTSYASLILICSLSFVVDGEESLFWSATVESKSGIKHLYFAFAKWEDLSFPLNKGKSRGICKHDI